MQRYRSRLAACIAGACAWLLNASLQKVEGVKSVSVNATSHRAVLRFDPAAISLGHLLEAVAKIGFEPTPISLELQDSISASEYHAALKRLIVAGAAGMQVMMFALALYFGDYFGIDASVARFLKLVSLLVTVPIVFYAATPFFAGAWRGLRMRTPGMDLPVSIAIGSAFAASIYTTLLDSGQVYFDSVAMFVFFLNASRFLEMRAQHRSEDQAAAFAALLPETVLRIGPKGDEWVAPCQLANGDRVRVRPGDVVPVDGVVLSGMIAVDESILTGESMAIERGCNAKLRAGAVVCSGTAIVEATQTGMRTSLAEIGRMLDRARADRPPVAVLADHVAAHFVTAVLLLTTVTAFAWHYIDPARAFEVALATLVVTCPCALALATPAALAAATTQLSKSGFLLVRSRVLEVLTKRPTIVFDKTGTLTEGHPSIVGTLVTSQSHLSETQLLSLAASLEATSEHVLARAFAPHHKPGVYTASNTVVVAGAGVSATVDGIPYRLGKLSFASADCHTAPVADGQSRATHVYLGSQGQLLARFDINDKLRIDAKDTVTSLQERGYRCVIASGDRRDVVRAAASALDISEYHANLTPADKLRLIEDLRRKGETVIMVGDGINDAPVLAAADASVALDAGTALARASADAVSLGQGLSNMLAAVDIAHATRRVIRQNLAWAVAYNITAVPLAVSGMLAPWMAAAGMSASSLIVVLNAIRLHRSETRSGDNNEHKQAVTATSMAYE